MKNHFITSYAGNKRQEVEKLFEILKFDNIDTIIEPCCGTSAVSYYISLQHPKKFKYILNDLNKQLIELYTIMKDKEKCKKLEEDLNKVIIKFNEFKIQDLRNIYWNHMKKHDNNIVYYLFTKKYAVLGKMCPLFNKCKAIKKFTTDSIPIVKFLQTEDVTISTKLDIDICNEFKDNENA